MKIIIHFQLKFIFLFLFSCTLHSFAQTSFTKKIIKKDFYEKTKQDSLIDHKLEKKDGQILVTKEGYKIMLQNGKTISLKNYEKADSIVIHKYVGSIKNFSIFKRDLYENHDYLIVNIDSGKKINLDGYPYFSADFKQILALSTDLYETPQNTTIKLLSFNNGILKVIYEDTMDIAVKKCFWTKKGNIYINYSKTVDFLKYQKNDDGKNYYLGLQKK